MTIIKYSFTIESISCMKSDWERTGIIFVYIRTDRRWRLCISDRSKKPLGYLYGVSGECAVPGYRLYCSTVYRWSGIQQQ